MTEPTADPSVERFALSDRRYRLVDTVTKLAGVALLAGSFEVGIASTVGVALALSGAALAVCTVFVNSGDSA